MLQLSILITICYFHLRNLSDTKHYSRKFWIKNISLFETQNTLVKDWMSGMEHIKLGVKQRGYNFKSLSIL